MKCKNCGAEVNTETMVCEYCGSQNEKRGKVRWGIFWTAVIVIILILTVTFIGIPLIGATWLYSAARDELEQQEVVEQEQELLVNRLPQNATDLMGQMRECNTKGVVTIYYNDKFYEDVQILDRSFIDWMVEEGIAPDGMDIIFSTDENRNITSVYLKGQEDFVVMYQEGDIYVAFTENEEIVAYKTDMELKVDDWYTGYFHYADNHIYTAIASGCHESYGQFYYKCEEKVELTEYSANTNEAVMVYKLLVGNDWYYCSKDTYDTVNVGDDLKEDYTFVLAKKYVYK